MFEKLKKLKEIQNFLSQEKIEAEKRGVKITINGKMQVEEVCLNPELSKKEQEETLRDCFNEAMKKLQLKLAQQMPKIGF